MKTQERLVHVLDSGRNAGKTLRFPGSGQAYTMQENGSAVRANGPKPSKAERKAAKRQNARIRKEQREQV